jgi:hypothetical protein
MHRWMTLARPITNASLPFPWTSSCRALRAFVTSSSLMGCSWSSAVASERATRETRRMHLARRWIRSHVALHPLDSSSSSMFFVLPSTPSPSDRSGGTHRHRDWSKGKEGRNDEEGKHRPSRCKGRTERAVSLNVLSACLVSSLPSVRRRRLSLLPLPLSLFRRCWHTADHRRARTRTSKAGGVRTGRRVDRFVFPFPQPPPVVPAPPCISAPVSAGRRLLRQSIRQSHSDSDSQSAGLMHPAGSDTKAQHTCSTHQSHSISLYTRHERATSGTG